MNVNLAAVLLSFVVSKICYLHMGFGKTASSSFQETCKINKDLLEGSRITYPIFTFSGRKRESYNHSFVLISLFAENPENLKHNYRRDVASNIKEVNTSTESQLDGLLGSSENILLSGEMIPSLSKDSLSALIDKISSYDYEIKATALIRSPYSALCSNIQQKIKGGVYLDLISFNNSVPSSFAYNMPSYVKKVKKLQSVFGQCIHFHSFENACAHSYGPVGFLLEEFVNQDPSTFEYKKTNESLSNLAVRIQNEFNRVTPSFIDKKRNPRFKYFPRSVDERLGFSGKFMLTEVEFVLVEELVKIQTEGLYEVAGLDFSKQSLKFSNPIF